MGNSIVSASDQIGITEISGMPLNIYGPDKAQQAICEFSKYGRITFSKEQYFKSTCYSFYFFKPVQKLKELYNLGDEVLILCCNNSLELFKSRTKDFIDYLLGPSSDYKNRLDKVTCFLLDDSADLESIITSDRKANPETRLIVPFSYNELSRGLKEEFLLDRLRSFLYERDLFSIASPLKNEYLFFGKERTNTISELFGKYRQGEHGGVFGLRRIGKTSILNLLKQRVLQNQGVAVYFDMSMLHHQRWNSLLHEVVQRIEREYAFFGIDAADIQLPEEFALPAPAARYNESKASLSFEEDIKNLYHAFGDRRILLIFDEIEQIGYSTSPSEHWRTGNDALFFWQVIRAVFQMNPELYSFVIAGVNPKCIEIDKINNSDNPIFNMLTPIYISLFNLNDVKDMVSSIGGHIGLRFDEEIYTKLIDDYGGHPFLTRRVCSIINTELLKKNEPRPYTVSKYSYEEQAAQFQSGLVDVIKQILSVLQDYYPEEFELLKRLALNGSNSFKNQLKLGESSIPHLMGYCLIMRVNDNFYFQIKSVEKYIKDTYRYDKVLSSTAEKWAQISVRRNTIESELRNIIKLHIQTQYGKKSKERLVEIISEIAKDDSKQILRVKNAINIEKAMEELYFSQLKTIIKKNWKYFDKLFIDVNKFEFCLDRINEYRADAHAKDIDDDDLAMLNYSFKFFEEILDIT